jgi:hypothetical protein
MFAINRSAVVVKLKQPYVDWARRATDGLASTLPGQLGTVYLFPEFTTREEGEALLEQVCQAIFETELEQWGVDQEVWPRERDWDSLHQWFDVELHANVWETVEQVVEEPGGPDGLGPSNGDGIEIE